MVSLLNVQGLGWRGVPHDIASDIDNLRQRVFCENGPEIGGSPLSVPFEMPALKDCFDQDTLQQPDNTFADVVVNGDRSVTFRHQLQGAGSQYKYSIVPGFTIRTSHFRQKPRLLRALRQISRNLSGAGFDYLQPGQELTPAELAMFAKKYSKPYTKGVVLGGGYNKTVQLIYEKTPDELQKNGCNQSRLVTASIPLLLCRKMPPRKRCLSIWR